MYYNAESETPRVYDYYGATFDDIINYAVENIKPGTMERDDAGNWLQERRGRITGADQCNYWCNNRMSERCLLGNEETAREAMNYFDYSPSQYEEFCAATKDTIIRDYMFDEAMDKALQLLDEAQFFTHAEATASIDEPGTDK